MQRLVLMMCSLAILSACAVSNPAPVPEPSTIIRAGHSGDRFQVGFYFSIAPTCEATGYPEIFVVTPPQHGSMGSEKGNDYPSFKKDNVRWICDSKLLPTTEVFYQSSPGYHGADSFKIKVVFPDASVMTSNYSIDVL
jgi:hypothetical protein